MFGTAVEVAPEPLTSQMGRSTRARLILDYVLKLLGVAGEGPRRRLTEGRERGRASIDAAARLAAIMAHPDPRRTSRTTSSRVGRPRRPSPGDRGLALSPKFASNQRFDLVVRHPGLASRRPRQSFASTQPGRKPGWGPPLRRAGRPPARSSGPTTVRFSCSFLPGSRGGRSSSRPGVEYETPGRFSRRHAVFAKEPEPPRHSTAQRVLRQTATETVTGAWANY